MKADRSLYSEESDSYNNHDHNGSDAKTSLSDAEDSSEHNMPKIASRETRQLGLVKGALIFVLLASTILISFAVYYITHKSEEDQFEAQFEDQATRLLQEFSLVLLSSIGALDNLSVTIT